MCFETRQLSANYLRLDAFRGIDLAVLQRERDPLVANHLVFESDLDEFWRFNMLSVPFSWGLVLWKCGNASMVDFIDGSSDAVIQVVRQVCVDCPRTHVAVQRL